MNNTLSSQSRIHTTINHQAVNDRRARTRLLIQLGALINLTALPQICQIEEGDDLQFDIESRDKAATLLGILLDTTHNIPDPPDAGQMETWRESGTRVLKQRAAHVNYQQRKGKIK